MRITSVRALPGPNIYVDKPVLRARIELEEFTEKESFDFPGFTERLLSILPGLRQHHCAKGEPGGFVERLHGGTYFGHIIEHTAIELCNLAGIGGNFGRTVYADAPGRYDMMMEYKNEAGGRYLFQVALELVQAVVTGEEYELGPKLAEAMDIAARTALGPSTQAVVDAAEKRGIPWYRLDEMSLVQLGYGANRRLVQATLSERTSCLAADIASDKALTKQILEQSFIPVPRGIVARSKEEAVAAVEALRGTLAVKPLGANQGKGVSLRVHTAEEVAQAYERAAEYSRDVVVEEFFEGHDYRVLIVNGQRVAASERLPASVVGDGVLTVAELIEVENQNPLRGVGHDKALTKIRVDESVKAVLKRRGQSLQTVPPRGERVYLRETANLSTGGTARDVTDELHPEVARMCERAARLIGLDICGVDLILKDITQPIPKEGGGGIIEVNASPGIRMHHFPAEGKPRDVGASIVDMLYPPGANGRVPIVSITGTNGKTTVTRLVGHTLGVTNKTVGVTTTDGIWVRGHQIAEGDLTGFQSARAVLSDPTVEYAVLETARGGIMNRSLGFDWCDVGVLTNIQPDHFGVDGIHSLEDLLDVKSLVAERVRAGGTIVLNADDPLLATLPEKPRIRKLARQIVYFALSEENPIVRKHVDAGGTAYFMRDGWIIEAEGFQAHRVAHVAHVPITMGGAVRFQTANALAAVAACRALGLAREIVARGLATFHGNEHNQGRMNLYKVRNGYVLVDYGHNPAAFAAMQDFATSWPRRVTAVFTVPGDRSDDIIREGGRQAARSFDRLIIREDEDLRGRRPGEIADLICDAAKAEQPEKECRIIPGEAQALRTALEEMEDGEVVLFFFEKQSAPSAEVLKLFRAEPTEALVPAGEPELVYHHG